MSEDQKEPKTEEQPPVETGGEIPAPPEEQPKPKAPAKAQGNKKTRKQPKEGDVLTNKEGREVRVKGNGIAVEMR